MGISEPLEDLIQSEYWKTELLTVCEVQLRIIVSRLFMLYRILGIESAG